MWLGELFLNHSHVTQNENFERSKNKFSSLTSLATHNFKYQQMKYRIEKKWNWNVKWRRMAQGQWQCELLVLKEQVVRLWFFCWKNGNFVSLFILFSSNFVFYILKKCSIELNLISTFHRKRTKVDFFENWALSQLESFDKTRTPLSWLEDYNGPRLWIKNMMSNKR